MLTTNSGFDVMVARNAPDLARIKREGRCDFIKPRDRSLIFLKPPGVGYISADQNSIKLMELRTQMFEISHYRVSKTGI